MTGMFNYSTVADGYQPDCVATQLHPMLADQVALAGMAVNWRLLERGSAAVLDVGAGAGAGLEFLRARAVAPDALRYTGIDAAAVPIAMAARHYAGTPHRFLVGDAQALPFADAAFDVVFELRLFQFLNTPARAVAEMTRVSRGLTMMRLFSTEEPSPGFHPMFTRLRLRADGSAEPNPMLAEAGHTVLYRHLLREAGNGWLSYPCLRHRRVIPAHGEVERALAAVDARVVYRHDGTNTLQQILSPEPEDGPTGGADTLVDLPVRQTTVILHRQP